MRTFLVRFQLMTGLGIILSCYLLYHHTSVKFGYLEGNSFCTVSAAFDCDKVAKSEFSELFGFPVASFGLVYYFAYLYLATAMKRRLGKTSPEGGSIPVSATEYAEIERRGRALLLFAAALSLPPTLILFGLSELVIGTLCLMCCISYAINILLFVLAYLAPAQKGGLGADLTTGFSQSLSMGTDRLDPLGRLERLSIVLGAVTMLLLASMAPQALVRFHFEPRRMRIFDPEVLAPYVEEWRGAVQHQLPVRTGSLEERDFALGSPTAPITVVEFSDFECPFCQRHAHTLKPWVMANPGKVHFVFKNYPLDQTCNVGLQKRGHLYACKAAKMARCAGVQGEKKFWEMHDALFNFPWDESDDTDPLIEQVGLDAAKFSQCMSDPAFDERIKQDIEEGNRVKIKGTPSFFVNGRQIIVEESMLTAVLSAISNDVKSKGK